MHFFQDALRSNHEVRSGLTKTGYAIAFSTCLLSSTAAADAPNVVTTIKPVHSIAAAIMDGVGTPHILIDGAASPHGFSLKPSQAFLLQGADAVFWVGPSLTPSLDKAIHSMAAGATVVELMELDGIEHLGIRESDQFDGHDHDHGSEEEHDDDDHEKHSSEENHDHEKDHGDEHEHEEEHAHNDSDDHDKDHKDEHAEGHEDDHEEEHADGHEHEGSRDAHIWLNPENGITIAKAMAETLSELDPENAKTYQENAKQFSDRITSLNSEIAGKLEAVKGGKFIVFHDAYHHFEHHYDIEASGSVTVTPEALSSADRVSEIQTRVRSLDISCVFQEPQFESKLVDVVIEGSDAKVGTLDPLGTMLENGPELYPALLDNLAASMVDCLK
ncbi:MAG: zinc ABC transporter substrate-binding protein [Roseibium sp.]